MKIVETSRKIKASPVHVINKIPDEKNGSIVTTMSRNERNLAWRLLFKRNVARFDCQPFTCLLHMDGAERRYTPDFCVYFKDDATPLVIEVKPTKFLQDLHLQKKLALVARDLPKLGYRFMIMTENQYPNRTEFFNLRFLFSHRKRLPSVPVMQEVMALVDQGFDRIYPLDDYIRRHDSEHSTVYSLITHGYLKTDMASLIDHRSRVVLAGCS